MKEAAGVAEMPSNPEDSVRFVDNAEFVRHQHEVRDRFADPQQRLRMRASQRAQVENSYPDLRQALRIEPGLEQQLLDLLAEQQMYARERHAQHGIDESNFNPSGDAYLEAHQAQADAHTRDHLAIESLLGEDRFERYLDYKDTLAERQKVIYFEQQLHESDWLTPQQKEDLISLLREQELEKLAEKYAQDFRAPRQGVLPAGLMDIDPAAHQRTLQQMNVESNEEMFRKMQAESQQLLQRLPQILTPRQLDTYQRMENDRLASQRDHVQRLRLQAGMALQIPAALAASAPKVRNLFAGSVRFKFSLKVNRGAPAVWDLPANGQTSVIEAPEKLLVVATPTLFEDGWLTLELKFHEQRSTGQHRLIGHSGAASLTSLAAPVRGARTVADVRGARGYAVVTEMDVLSQ